MSMACGILVLNCESFGFGLEGPLDFGLDHNTAVYEETLTGRPVKKLPVTKKMWMQFNVMPRTSIVDIIIIKFL